LRDFLAARIQPAAACERIDRSEAYQAREAPSLEQRGEKGMARNPFNKLMKYYDLGFECRNPIHFTTCCNFEQSLPR
jgi:hypothetical protein